jgi:amino acid permease
MEENKAAMTANLTPSGFSEDLTHFEGVTTVVEKSNTVKRGLKSRHMQFYAIGGTIGTGLFIGIGGGLATGGPLSLFLGYSITGLAIFAMVSCDLLSSTICYTVQCCHEISSTYTIGLTPRCDAWAR